MKKCIGVLLAVFLVVGFAGQAAASFGDGTLTQVVYNANDNEVAVDLGITTGLDYSPYSNVELAAPGSVELNDFGSEVNAWADLNVGYFSATGSPGYIGYFSTTKTSRPDYRWDFGLHTGGTDLYSEYDSDDVDGDGINVQKALETSNPNTFEQKLGANYGGFNIDSEDGLANLGALDSGGSVDMYLYRWDIATPIDGPTGEDYQGILRLNADGSTVLNPVPVPGAVLLFGTGLLGFFGIRRKKA